MTWGISSEKYRNTDPAIPSEERPRRAQTPARTRARAGADGSVRPPGRRPEDRFLAASTRAHTHQRGRGKKRRRARALSDPLPQDTHSLARAHQPPGAGRQLVEHFGRRGLKPASWRLPGADFYELLSALPETPADP